jgi:hypothetical protein
MSDTEKIRELNDAFRMTLISGVVRVTGLLRYYSKFDKAEIMRRIRTFDDWKTDNGHRSEHDFGHFKFADEQHVFWAIHYQDANDIGKPSVNPADPTKTKRLLIVTIAEWQVWYDNYEDE